jgi:tetratricopeptide (TPR) repeat protein
MCGPYLLPMGAGLPWPRVLVAVAVAVTMPAQVMAAPSTLEDPDRTVARRYFEEGAADYERGDYEAALRAFTAALALSPSPALHYNIARCADRLGDWTRAADEYERYLPGARDDERAGLQERIRLLRARQQPPAPAPPATVRTQPAVPVATAPRESDRATARAPDVLGRAAIAVGVLALAGAAVGGGLYGSARADFNGLERTCELRQCTPPDWASVDRRAAGAYASWAIAGAAAATGVALLIARAHHRRAERLTIAPAPAGVVVGGRF